jgi:hypothetical protein
VHAAAKHGIRLEVVKHAEAKHGFVLLPRRWVVERSFAYPVCNPTTRPETLPVRTKRHNPHLIATLRRQIATHLARSLP